MKIAFVDESSIELDNEKCLLYGVYVCCDLSSPANAMREVRKVNSLHSNIEIKWSINTGDRTANAKIKEDFMTRAHGADDAFLISITRGNDKAAGFTRCLEQIHNHFRIRREESYGVIYDHDSTPNKRQSATFVKTLPGPPFCLLFADAASELTAGISVADCFVGSYRYMLWKHGVENQTLIEVHPELFLPVDEFFWEIYRRLIPGEFRWDPKYLDGDEELAKQDTGYRYTEGHGLFLDPTLTEKQRNCVEPFINLHAGCTI